MMSTKDRLDDWFLQDYYSLKNKYAVAMQENIKLKKKIEELEREIAFIKQEYNGLKDRYDVFVKKNGELIKKLKEKE